MTPEEKVAVMKQILNSEAMVLNSEAMVLWADSNLRASDSISAFVRSCSDTSLERLFDIVSASSEPLGGLNPVPGNEA